MVTFEVAKSLLGLLLEIEPTYTKDETVLGRAVEIRVKKNDADLVLHRFDGSTRIVSLNGIAKWRAYEAGAWQVGVKAK